MKTKYIPKIPYCPICMSSLARNYTTPQVYTCHDSDHTVEWVYDKDWWVNIKHKNTRAEIGTLSQKTEHYYIADTNKVNSNNIITIPEIKFQESYEALQRYLKLSAFL